MQGLVKNVLAEAEKVYTAVTDKNYVKLEKLVDRLQEETKNCKNRFQDR